MKCPTCPDSTLLMSERQGVEIDYCPHCRGVWLDRGELDKLIQLAGAPPAEAHRGGQVAPQVQHQPQQRGFDQRGFEDSDFGKHHRQGGHYRRKSWLSDFFD